MRSDREAELTNEFFRMWDAKTSTMADNARTQLTSIYTDPAFLNEERKRIFRGRPLVFCLSGELREVGDYVCADLDGLPVVVLRGEDERLRALVNMCRHRGARVFTEERGCVSGRGIACPFHAWTYDIYGRLLGQPVARESFAECDREKLALRELEIIERHGIVYVTPVRAEQVSQPYSNPELILGAADEDIADLALQSCRLIESKTRTLNLNWKLVIDTFLEAYHVFSLHRNSLATRQFSAPNPFEDLGPVGLVVGVRKSILDERDKLPEERRYTPHATLQYILYPNVIISHQIDHIETWRVFPGSKPDEAIATTSIYSYGDELDERTERYLRRSIEVLMDVTDKEDFPLVAQTQKALNAGSSAEFVFGRNEPGLIAYHKWLDKAMVV